MHHLGAAGPAGPAARRRKEEKGEEEEEEKEEEEEEEEQQEQARNDVEKVTRQNIFNGGSLAAHLAGARRVTICGSLAGHLNVFNSGSLSPSTQWLGGTPHPHPPLVPGGCGPQGLTDGTAGIPPRSRQPTAHTGGQQAVRPECRPYRVYIGQYGRYTAHTGQDTARSGGLPTMRPVYRPNGCIPHGTGSIPHGCADKMP